MKHLRSLTILSLVSLLSAGCVSTSTHKKSVDEAAALSANLTDLTAEHGKLEDQAALCSKDLADSERRRAETQKQLGEKQIALERAQADIVRIEKVLSDRNQEAGKTMTEMRQEIDRLTAQLQQVKKERAQL
jgi:predicted  nucleic acid-binding Zn-ribbon protein